MDLGPHGFYILAAYGFTMLVIGGLMLGAVVGHRAQRAALADLEARGVRRRSDLAQPSAEPGRTAAPQSVRPW